MFNSKNFDEIDYLKFDCNFKIEVNDRIKIILGPNGTGKTSIYTNIKNHHNDYSFIDYKDVELSVIAKKNKIIIGPSITKLADKKKEKLAIESDINIRENLSEFNITNATTAKAISNKLETLRKNFDEAVSNFSDENLESLFSLSESDSLFLKDNYEKIKLIEKIETKVETIKDSYRKHILEKVEQYITDDEKKCPICGVINEKSIKEIIKEELSKISDIKETIVKNYQEKNINLSPKEILDNVNNLVKIVKDNKIEISNLINYLLCGGSKEKAKTIINYKPILLDINKEINELELRKKEFYKNLKEKRETLINTFEFQFDVNQNDINYNETEKNIEIKLPRKVEQYSTGEINLMTFVICILEFISSDKKSLVIDDPLSSYDIPNQYKIIYEIASLKTIDKKILVFTHNINTVNIANSQHNGLFSYDVLEKKKSTIFINSINYFSKDNIITIKNLIENLDDKYSHKKYLELIMQKDTWKKENKNHLIFHFDEPYSKEIDGYNYSNDYLVNLIDNFDDNSLNNTSFVENTANKIIYTAALRIWIEKQFYLITKNDVLLYDKEFSQKIDYIFKNGKWTGSPKVTKEFLMSKKVMLNQHIHQTSQEMPFYFSLNLSLDDVINEIKDIKGHFKR